MAMGLTLSLDDAHESTSSTEPALDQLVAVTEDYAEDIPGCDAVSVFDLREGEAVHRGRTRISPGRLAASRDLSLLVATQSNSSVILDYKYHPFLYVAERIGATYRWSTAAILGGDFATYGGIAVLSQERELLVATSNKADNDGWLVNRSPFQVRKYRLPGNIRDMMRIGPPSARFTTEALALEILLSPDEALAHVVTAKPSVQSINVDTMVEDGPSVVIPPLEGLRVDWHDQPVSYWQATISSDGRRLITNRGRVSEVTVVDLRSRSAITAALASDIELVGGVALSPGPNHPGLLAVHAYDKVALYNVDEANVAREVGRESIKPPDLELDDKWCCTGPHLSIEWSPDGSQVIAATSDGEGEFAVFDVSQEGEALHLSGLLTACRLDTNLPNDIVAAKRAAPPTQRPETATSTASATLTGTPESGATTTPPATASPSVAATGTSPATATSPQPAYRLWLPLVRSEEAATPSGH
jgi:hypothetical protein